MIVETAANRFYCVIETGREGLAHVWYGREVKRDKALGWTKKGPNRAFPELVRKAGCIVVDKDASIGVLAPGG